MKKLISKFSTLFLAESTNAAPPKSIFQILKAASCLEKPIDMLFCGKNALKTAQKVKLQAKNVKNILVLNDSAYDNNQAQVYESLLLKLIKERKYQSLVLASNTLGKDVLPRVASHFDSQPVTDIIQLLSPTQYIRPIYASNAIQIISCQQTIKFLSFRASSFPQQRGQSQAQVISIEHSLPQIKAKHIKYQISQTQKPQLSTAKIVVSGGRGLKSKQNFNIIQKLATSLGQAAVGASRAAVDSGFCPNQMQVGQTGKVVAPDLYIAVGISGAVQHLAGMKDSKIIVAINKDEQAPIFSVSTYGLVADLFKAVPQFQQKIKKI